MSFIKLGIKYTLHTRLIAILVVVFPFVGVFDYWILNLAIHFTPYWFWYSLFFCILGLLWKDRIITTISIICGCGHLIILTADLTFDDLDFPDQNRSFEVLSLNVDHKNKSYGQIASKVVGLNSDIVVLTEINRKLEIELQGMESEYQKYIVHSNKGFGVAVYSRFPIKKCRAHLYIKRDIPTVHCYLLVYGKEMSLWAIHPPTPLRMAHKSQRDFIFGEVAESIADDSSLRMIVGDFNTTPWGDNLEIFKNSGMRASMDGLLGILAGTGSFPAWLPIRILIDNVMYGSHLGEISRHYVDGVGSDHLGLVVRLSFNPESIP